MSAANVAIPTIPLGAASILVVEHEADVAEQLCRELSRLGFKICACVSTGANSIQAAFAYRPDLVLINAVLPGEISGIVAARDIYAGMQIPILFLSAYSDPATVASALDAHPYAYLTKPFDISELYAQLLVCLARGNNDSHTREALMWYEATLRSVTDAVIVTDSRARLRYLNPTAERLLGAPLKDVLGRDMEAVLTLQDLHGAPLSTSLLARISGPEPDSFPHIFNVISREGQRRAVEDTVTPICNDRGDLLGALMILTDVQQRNDADLKLRVSEERFRNAFDLAPNGMALATADGRFIQVNNALCQMLAADAASMVGASLDDFGANPAMIDTAIHTLLTQKVSRIQFEHDLQAGSDVVFALVSMSMIRLPPSPDILMLQVYDLTERKKAERLLIHLAQHDALTDLPNRTAIIEGINRQIASAKRHGKRMAVVFLDLDHFKHINDSLGHEVGDELLKAIAVRLRSAVRESDLVGRLGGDEFVVLLPELDHLGDIGILASKIQSECLKPIYLNGHELRIGTSLGISVYPDDATEPDALLRYADSAMYTAKAAGRNTVAFYQRDMTEGMEERLRLAASLRQAVEEQQFELYFQPIVALESSIPLAAEALLRWNHPQLGMLAPDDFLPLAEEIGLGAQIGAWALEAACLAASSWTGSVGAVLTLAVNIAPSQFRAGGLVDLVSKTLARSAFPASRLKLEITEHVVLKDTASNRDTLQRLKAIGVGICIDDFGTGYSSLSYMIKFGPSEMKIDRSLVEHICEMPEHEAIVRAAVAMAHSLQICVVAEGIENADQHALLRRIGCDFGQGFWYRHPLSTLEFRELLGNLSTMQ